MATYSTATLLDTIKRKAFIPNLQSTFTDTDLLAIADEEIFNTILPAIMNTREEYYVNCDQRPLNTNVSVPYPIPSRAVGMGVREISVTVGGVERNIPRRSIEDKVFADNAGFLDGFYLKNNDIYVLGRQSGTLNIYYYLRPNRLVSTTEATTITGINQGTNTITVNNVPAGWITGTKLDVINHNPGFETKHLENSIASISSTDIILADTLPTYADNSLTISTGNWVSVAETSPVPQVPLEFFQYLGEAVTAYIMESLGDQEGYQRAQQRMQMMMDTAQRTISPRVDGESKKAVPRKNRGTNTYNNWKWY